MRIAEEVNEATVKLRMDFISYFVQLSFFFLYREEGVRMHWFPRAPSSASICIYIYIYIFIVTPSRYYPPYFAYHQFISSSSQCNFILKCYICPSIKYHLIPTPGFLFKLHALLVYKASHRCNYSIVLAWTATDNSYIRSFIITL